MGRAEALGVLLDLVEELLGRGGLPDLIDDPELLRPLEVEGLARRHEFDRGALVDQARQPLGAAGARQDAERDLGEPDLAGALAGDAEIGRHRDLEATADRVAVERRDDELGRVLEPVEGLVRVEAEVVLEDRVDGLQHVDVGARAEELLARAAQHEDVHVLVESRLENGVVEVAHHLVGVGVRGRIDERDPGHAVLHAVVHQLGLRGFHGLILRSGRGRDRTPDGIVR